MKKVLSCEMLLGVDEALEKGVSYLHEHQLPNGEFVCYYAPDEAMREWTVPDSAVFPTAVIASCLLPLRDLPKVKKILDNTATFLTYQIMYGGVWNFFTKWNPLFKYCPADLDSTVFASHVLKTLKVDFPDNEALFLQSRDERGLFYTWVVLRPARNSTVTNFKIMARELKRPFKSLLFWFKHEVGRNDVDVVVNANILFYLGATEQTKPIINYLLKVLYANEEERSDKWYKDASLFYYFLSRNYVSIKELEPAKQIILDRINSSINPDGSFGKSAFSSALAILTLINFNQYNESLDAAVESLLQAQDEFGCWERHIFFYSGPSKKVGWGSEEITTAFCIQALASYKGFISERY